MSIENELNAAKNLNKEVLGDVGRGVLRIEIEERNMSEEDIKNRQADVEVFFRTYFKKVLALTEYDWLKEFNKNAETPGQILWHRGKLAALLDIRQWFEDQTLASMARFKKGEPSKPGEALPPIPGE